MFFSPFLRIYKIIILIILITLANVSCVKQKAKTVTTLIDTKWEVTPLVLEIAEYVGDESKDDFWSFLNDICKLNPQLIELESDRFHYDTALKVAEKYLSKLQIKALKLALSLHIFSPKIEMFGQMALERGLPESRCPSGIDFNGRLFCDAEEFSHYFKKKMNAKDPTDKPEIYPEVDHIYPGSENHSHIAILYGELGTSEFAHMHSVLRDMALQGSLTYLFRHYVKERPNKRVRLSGYGVELQMKSTEYKVMDDVQVKSNESSNAGESDDPDEEIEGLNFYKLKNLYPEQKEGLDKFRSHLLETSNEMAPLKVWQVQELSLQAAERILSSSSGEEALRTMTHIAHNFPLQARSLIRTRVRPELKKEILKNQQTFDSSLNLSPNDAAIFINGMYFDVDVLDIISLLEILRQELRIMEKLHKIGIEDEEIKKLIGLDLMTSSSEYAIDIRDSAVVWFNDIESDKRYRKWPDSLRHLLRPTFPGMLKSIRRNLYNLVLILDPSKKESKPLLKLMESFYIHMAPLRLGIVFALTSDASKTGLQDAGIAMLNAFNYVSEVKSPYGGLSFITDIYASIPEDRDITAKDIQTKLKEKYPSIDIDQIFGEDTAYDTGRKLSIEFIQRSGFRSSPQALLNGIPLSEKRLNAVDFEEGVLNEIMSQTPQLQKAVFKEEFMDTDSAIDYLMGRPNVMPRLNERILSENAVYLDLTGDSKPHASPAEFEKLSGREKIATLLKTMKYLVRKAGQNKKPDLITHWIVADLDVPKGRNLLKFALEQMKNSASIRVGVIVNPSHSVVTPITELILTCIDMTQPDIAATYILKILQNEEVYESLDDFKRLPDFRIEGLDLNKMISILKEGSTARRIIAIHRAFVKSVLKFKPGDRGVITNGRIIGPFDPEENFVVDDFSLLDRFSYNNYGQKILEVLMKKKDIVEADGDGYGQLSSDILMQAMSIVASRSDSRVRFSIPLKTTEQMLSSVNLPPQEPSFPAFDIVAIVDPVSKGAQKIGPILSVLHQTVNCHVRVFLNCVEKNSDLPLKSFYKYVLEPELQFQQNGRLTSGPIAKFSNLPTSVLFTQNMHVPENWIVESIRSPHDLDNIKLDNILDSTVHSEFELEYLLLEGHCFEALLGNPPRGLQITLGTQNHPVKYDTIVMANLGYFQLKANPGAWTLRLREGRSSEIYNIMSNDVENSVIVPDIKVIISSFRSHVLKLKVQKKPDKINMDLLVDDNDPGSGIWNSITSSFSSKPEETDDVINIFSLASGHLYERFIKIMMLSVIKQTKTPVKFWFLKNYLSPTLKDFLPHMAKEYGFEYELVEYKWPRWLHQQSEKQRIIWGYKILFLDVLFPLHVKKIIFVDADQVVRADLKELRDLDLGGAPYGYTPFCNSRREMDGFRFWNQGYWRNHLQGRRYHISALYVVDLKRFRRIAAGDRLRGQYQALSKDPNSLSNLDQDLPNNMIHQVAIKSLPEEWLWCETWCDDASKKYAKTIDLCNNPLTKEAKLTAAMRIIEEWKDYDHEIKELQRKIDMNTQTEEVMSSSKPSPAHHVHVEL